VIELYHFAVSTCSQKVRLVFAEKGIDFVSHEIDLMSGGQHDPEYVKLNPNHVVPTVVHDGSVILESSLIIRYLDEIWAEPAMRPADALGRYDVDLWLMHVDEKLHPAAPVVTFAVGPRNMLLQLPADVREERIAAIPDPKERAERRSVIEYGVKAPEFGAAIGVFVDTLDRMETALANQAWLSGPHFGLADASALPYVLRLEHLAMDPLLAPSARPRVADWFARTKSRPSYATAVDKWLAPPVVEMLRKNGEAVWADVEPLTRSAS